MNSLKNIITTALSLITILAVSEFTVRSIGVVQKIQTGWNWNNSPLRHLQPETAATETNELGIRGQKILYNKQDFVILLVGDSQVESAASAMHDMPEIILQTELVNLYRKPVKVFSLASSGWGQDQQLIAMEHYFEKYTADLVLVWATPGNDFWENAFPDRSTTVAAGHLKPTFYKDGDELKGPLFEDNFYYMNSAIIQLVVQALNYPVNEMILKYWKRKIPWQQKIASQAACADSTEIHQREFFENIFSLDHSGKYTIITDEDVGNSRSHFSPLTIPSTEMDEYQEHLTKLLFKKMRDLATMNGSKFRIFYPSREDFDILGRSIKCIKTISGDYYGYHAEYEHLLRRNVPDENLLVFKISGKNENVVSKNDRHLDFVGNEKAMKKLSRTSFMLENINQ